MSTAFRYELKFVLDSRRLARARDWIAVSTRSVSRYAPRQVNSLYYDTPNLSALTDNLYGISERTKYRLRWYDDGCRRTAQALCFEVKKRHGRLNTKQRIELPDLGSTLHEQSHHHIRKHLTRVVGQTRGLEHFYGCFPSLQVRYLREYFEDPEGIRVTLDTNIDFHLTPLNSPIYFGRGVRHSWAVMEVKFPPQFKTSVSRTLSQLEFSPRRHSKYVAGLAAFGQASYF